MPRQSRGSRPTARAPPKPAPPAKQQTRPATTYAAPPGAASAPVPQPPAAAAVSQGPGLFGQMASTAAGVAVGSSIGHAVGSMFSGGSSEAAPAAAADTASPTSTQQQSNPCGPAFQMFSSCMEQNNSDGTACSWYFNQLKACQEANQ